MRPVYPESSASKYAAFMSAKLAYRDELKKICEPAHPAMRKWHKRQTGRCMAVLGARTDALIHLPFTIELSDGCSVGCEFCGLAAGKLKSVKFIESVIAFRSPKSVLRRLRFDLRRFLC
jgi:hypothetical protein